MLLLSFAVLSSAANAAEMDSVSLSRLKTYIDGKIITGQSAKHLDSNYKFNPQRREWNSFASYIAEIKGEFAGMDSEDWKSFDFMGVNAQEAMDYLSAVGNRRASSDGISSDEAMKILQSMFEDFCHLHEPKWNGLLPAEGLNFRMYIGYCDLNSLSGVTSSQIVAASCLEDTTFPAIRFDGTEDFTGKNLLYNGDLSKCTGLTAAQIMQFSDLRRVILPEIVFDGTEDFSGKQISQADFSSCTGLTAAQLMSVSDWERLKLPAVTFDGAENFTGKNLKGADLSKCAGITLAQLKSASTLESSKWPDVKFGPGDSLSGVYCRGVDFSECTSITPGQILSASNLLNAKFPAITFTGSENFTGKGLMNVDITLTKGITPQQLLSAGSLSQLKVTSEQFSEYEAVLREKKALAVWIDGVLTRLD